MYSYMNEREILEKYANECQLPVKLQCEYCGARHYCMRYLAEVTRILREYY